MINVRKWLHIKFVCYKRTIKVEILTYTHTNHMIATETNKKDKKKTIYRNIRGD